MSLLDNSAILKNSAFKQNFEVIRPGVGAHNETTGEWEEAASQTFPGVTGSIQPAKASDMQYMQTTAEGGTRITQAIRIYSSFDFKPGTLGADARSGDTISYKGLTWNVVALSDFIPHGHQKLFGVRFDGQDG